MQANKITPYYFGCYSSLPDFSLCRPGDASGFYGLENPPNIREPSLCVSLDNRFEQPGPPCDPTQPSCYRGAAPFPASVTCGRIKVQVYGQAGPDGLNKDPVPVSVGTSPLLDRASWVQPPYDGGECTP